jgi:beta-phosphoglucomutase family hydrolase
MPRERILLSLLKTVCLSPQPLYRRGLGIKLNRPSTFLECKTFMPETVTNAQIRGLIFDCDGTLADTMPLHFVAWRATLSQYNVPLDEDRFYSLAGQPTVHIVQLLLNELGIEEDAKRISIEKEQAFLDVLDEVQPIEPVVEIARQHHGKLPMGVGSGSRRDVVQRILKRIKLDDVFDCVVGAEDTEKHKPEPDVFLEVARQLNVPPEHCRVYEDADLGVEAARRANMACFDVRDVHTPRRITPA